MVSLRTELFRRPGSDDIFPADVSNFSYLRRRSTTAAVEATAWSSRSQNGTGAALLSPVENPTREPTTAEPSPRGRRPNGTEQPSERPRVIVHLNTGWQSWAVATSLLA